MRNFLFWFFAFVTWIFAMFGWATVALLLWVGKLTGTWWVYWLAAPLSLILLVLDLWGFYDDWQKSRPR